MITSRTSCVWLRNSLWWVGSTKEFLRGYHRSGFLSSTGVLLAELEYPAAHFLPLSFRVKSKAEAEQPSSHAWQWQCSFNTVRNSADAVNSDILKVRISNAIRLYRFVTLMQKDLNWSWKCFKYPTATWNIQVSETWHDLISIMSTHKYETPPHKICRRGDLAFRIFTILL